MDYLKISPLRKSRLVGLLMVGVLGIALFMALRLPIYPDEIAYRILLERFFASGGYKVSITPYCTEGFQVVPPHLLKLAAIFWSLLSFINSTLAYRLLPESLLVLSLGGVCWLAWRNGRIANPWFLLLFVPGVSIYGLVTIRPEIFICTALVFLLVAGICAAKMDKANANKLLLLALAVTTVYILVSYVHPKALYLVLPTLVVLGVILEKLFRKWARTLCVVVMMLCVCLTSYDAIKMHKLGYATCAAYPKVQATMNSLNVNVLDLFRNTSLFMTALTTANDKVRYNRTFTQLTFHPGYDIGVLPDVQRKSCFIKIENLFIQLIVVAAFVYVAMMIVAGLVRSVRHRKISRELLVYLGVSVTAGCQFFFNIPKNWYDISLSVFTLGILAFAASNFLDFDLGAYAAKAVRFSLPKLQLAIAIVAILSLGINYRFIYKSFVDGYVGPGLSTRTPLKKLEKFAQSQFKPEYENKLQPLVIDDLTYHMFRQHEKVYPVTYLILNGRLDPSVIDAELSQGRLIGITRCALWVEFNAVWKSRLLESRRFTTKYGRNIDICKWEVD